MKKSCVLIIILSLVLSCKKEVQIDFSEQNIERSVGAEISINYPKANGTTEVVSRINKTLESYIISQLNLNEDPLTQSSVADAITLFNDEFKSFTSEFPDSAQQWEAFIDGEVTYRSPEVISVVISTYMDTGGAHGNTHVKFFNFDPQTGSALNTTDLISNMGEFSDIVKTRLVEELESNTDIEDVFFGNDFQLPETIGYSDEGLVILYNAYEISSYALGITEFSIPYEDIQSFLLIN